MHEMQNTTAETASQIDCLYKCVHFLTTSLCCNSSNFRHWGFSSFSLGFAPPFHTDKSLSSCLSDVYTKSSAKRLIFCFYPPLLITDNQCYQMYKTVGLRPLRPTKPPCLEFYEQLLLCLEICLFVGILKMWKSHKKTANL